MSNGPATINNTLNIYNPDRLQRIITFCKDFLTNNVSYCIMMLILRGF